MAKDPACLFYIDNWLVATAEMDSDSRGWYLNLILHNYDKGSLPNDIEKLAVLASVKFSEFERFKQVFEQVLKQKFEQNEEGRLENAYAKDILQKREQFKDKRSRSGSIGFIVKTAMSIKGFNQTMIKKLNEDLYKMDEKQLEEAKSKQVLEQMLKLYINGNGIINKTLIKEEIKKEEPEKIYRQFDHLSLSIEKYELLLTTYSKKEIDLILNKIENYKKNTQYKDLYLTAKNWLEIDTQRNKTYTNGTDKKLNITSNCEPGRDFGKL